MSKEYPNSECNSTSGFSKRLDSVDKRLRIVKKDELTATERYVARKILSEAKRSLEWNEEHGEYRDDSSFMISLEKQELAALARALRKI